jgi:acetyl-CoA synthetase
MEPSIREIGERIQTLREIFNISREEMAAVTGVTAEQYASMEEGRSDIGISFAYKCAQRFGVDISDILEGKSPTLTGLSVVRAGKGLRIERRTGFDYVSLAPLFKNKLAEPFLVNAEFFSENEPLHINSHPGQEIDIIKKGYLRLQVGDNTEIIGEGDVAFFDSSLPHGMAAAKGADCEFYAIVLGGEEKKKAPEASENIKQETPRRGLIGIADRYVTTTVDSDGVFSGISFHDDEHFNFAFDVVDAIAAADPAKLAMLHIDRDMTERRFTFKDISRESNRAANYFRSLGLKKGDRVMMILKRHWQFWIAMMGLNKLGAIAIPASNQLLKKDIAYRFNAAGVKAVIATPDDDVPLHIEEALPESPTVEIKMIVGGPREGWRDFDADLPCFSSHFERTDVGGEDPLLMYFTSGTTGYPKIAVHVHKYPLGHYPTARYWHNVDPNGLHLTISDTGWAKAMWGKLYGQWLAEGAIFVYNFDRFHADEILPLFAKYNITTFCAPPTIYRFLIREDLGKYDLSSIKHASIAGEALNPEVLEQFKKHTGLTIMEAFGQTETTVVIGNFAGMKPRPGSMGKASPLYDVDLVDSDGNSVGVGETGEVVIRTDKGIPNGLFRGYYNDEEKTREAWHDGMYHLGDTAWRDEEGYYHYVGRVDDLIKSSGYRIGPFEIESVIMELPYVLECAVTAAPDEIRGQVVKASVVLTKNTQPSEELKKEIQNYVKEHTAPYKYPRIVEFLDELPKTVSGKIKRNELRNR